MKLITNHSVKFVGLSNIIYNHFNGNKSRKPKILTNGIISLSEHHSNKYNKHVYIFGEEHGLQAKCSNLNKIDYMSVNHFIIDQIENSDKFIDLFIETEYLHKNDKKNVHTTKLPEFMLNQIAAYFQTCFTSGSCPNIRYHYSDIRSKFLNPNTFYSKIDQLHFDLKMYNNNRDKIVYIINWYESITTEHSVDVINYRKVKNHRNFVDFFYDKFWQIDKQLKKIDDTIGKIIYGHLLECAQKNDINLISFAMLDTIINALKMGQKIFSLDYIINTFNMFSLYMIFSVSCFMDAYLTARMFRKFKEVKYYNSKEPQNIIIYAGNDHAENIRILLDKLGFNVLFEEFNNDACIDISMLKLPLFS